MSLVTVAVMAACVALVWQLTSGSAGSGACGIAAPAGWTDDQAGRPGEASAAQTSKIRSLDAATFAEQVATGVVVVDFWAAWCGPCRTMLPILDELADRLDGRAVVAKVNVDEAPSLARRFGITAIPTVVVLSDGQEVGRYVGVQPVETLLKAAEQAIAKQNSSTQ